MGAPEVFRLSGVTFSGKSSTIIITLYLQWEYFKKSYIHIIYVEKPDLTDLKETILSEV